MGKKQGRAANGMGSIRQRSDGRWEARYSAPDGRQRSVYANSQKAVIDRLKAVMRDIDAGAWHEPSKMTMAQWFEIWLTDYQAHISERTTRKYRGIIKKHFIPVIGKVRVEKLSPLHVRQTISAMQKAGRKESTIKNYMAIFSASIESAIEAGLIKVNPAKKIKLPRTQPQQFTVIDREDIPRFIALAKETQYSNEMVLMLLTGLRLGELRGLQWGDIDFSASTMHVQRQIQPRWKNLKTITPPKYGEDRILHLALEVLAILRDQRRKLAEMRIASDNWQEDYISKDLVFRNKNGKPRNDKTLYRAVKNVGAKMDITLHPHDLRHSYAVAALRSGADIKTVQHNLGHKTAKMTLDVYAAYTNDAGKEGAVKLSAYLQNITEKAN